MLTFGNTPVPYTVSWTGEERFSVGPCRHADGRAAICQAVAPGEGKPKFGAPHSQRQREAIANDLCDLCGKPLRNRTKVWLSHAAPRGNAATAWDILQVEPLLHRECAARCTHFCPSLRRDIANGTMMIRQVTRHRVQFAIMGPEYVAHYVPGYEAKPTDRIIGHAKVQLLGWKDRDIDWLTRGVE